MINEPHNNIAKNLIHEGRLIEAGFEQLRKLVIPETAPQGQIDDMRMAFMAGAQHLYASIMNILDPGLEPTDADMRRMHMIDSELAEYAKKLKAELTTNMNKKS